MSLGTTGAAIRLLVDDQVDGRKLTALYLCWNEGPENGFSSYWSYLKAYSYGRDVSISIFRTATAVRRIDNRRRG